MGSKNLFRKQEYFMDGGWFSTLHRMRWLVFSGLVLMSWVAVAQSVPADTIDLPKDTIAVVREPWLKMNAGLFVEGMIQRVPFVDGADVASQFAVGVEINRFTFGFYRSEVLGQYSEYLIFPNSFTLTSVHGGLFMGRQVLELGKWSGQVRTNLGAGDMVWSQEESGEDFTRDVFYLFKPELVVSYRVFSFFHGFGSVGYQWIGNLDLPGVQQDDFSGVTFGFGLRFGLYHQYEE